MTLLSRFYSTSSSSKEEAIDGSSGSIIKREINNWLIPGIPKRSIYKHSNFKIIPDHKVKIEEKIILILSNHEVI